MKSNDFQNLLNDFQNNFKTVSNSKSLETLKEKYISVEISRDSIFDWILSSNGDETLKDEYMLNFERFENKLWQNGIVNIPLFDDNTSYEDIETMFEEYGSYFQRYGCLTSEQIVSWDEQNVLFDDEIGNIEIVKRPDVLLNV